MVASYQSKGGCNNDTDSGPRREGRPVESQFNLEEVGKRLIDDQGGRWTPTDMRRQTG